MSEWVDTVHDRRRRERCAAVPVPADLPLLDAEQVSLLRRWVRADGDRRRTTLLKEAGAENIERADALCDLLLREGWIVRRERLSGATWLWESIGWRDLPRLQGLLGVTGERQRREQRQASIDQAGAWLQSWRETAATNALDPDLLDELERALAQLADDRSLRLDLLAKRLALLQAIAAWHDADEQGSRRDFALRARGATKALTKAEWRWLEASFDLERLRITRFVLVAWLAGDFELTWNGHQRVHFAPLHCLGLPVVDLRRASGATPPRRWWLIENRASFERQAQQREPGVALIWMPGRPPAAWMDAITHLLQLAPAPAWISADADPAGIDIACSVGARWRSLGLDWTPHQMGVPQWQATSQRWPLNEHDRRLLATLLARSDLPGELRALCEAMQLEGRKAEQEGWI